MDLDAVYRVLSDLVASVVSELDANGLPAPARAGVVNGGALVLDDCCGGQVAARLVRMWPTINFPQPNQVDRDCVGRSLAVVAGISIARCAPTPDDRGRPPTVEALDAAAQLLHRDALVLFSTLTCYEWPWDVVIGDSLPLGPEGDCQGVEQQVTFEVMPAG